MEQVAIVGMSVLGVVAVVGIIVGVPVWGRVGDAEIQTGRRKKD